MSTLQKIFNRVRHHLLTQRQRSADNDRTDARPGLDRCVYKSPSGLKCAVGCLIPSNLYRPEMENMSLSKLLGQDVLELVERDKHGWPKGDQACLLRRLQQVHDRQHPSTWNHHLAVIARNYDLKLELEP